MLSKLYRASEPTNAVTTRKDVLRAEHFLPHPVTEREYRVIVLDADDTLDVIIHYPNGDRECVWSLVKDSDPIDTVHEEGEETEPFFCHNCGAGRDKLRYDVTEGWSCLSCGASDADE